jgi:ferritin-like metal-binding protein YciE
MPAQQQQPAKSKSKSRKRALDVSEILALELREIHSAEKQLARALPRLSRTIETPALQEMIEQRVEQGEQIIQDVERGLDSLGENLGRKKNVVAEALLQDIREHADEIERGPALDVVLIAALQKTEHYCIAAWGTVKALASELGQEELIQAMERASQEGKEMDEQLTRLAMEGVMPLLLGEEDEDEIDDDDIDDDDDQKRH